MLDDSTRRRFVIGAVTVHAAGLSGCLGGDPDGGVGTSGKTGGTGGETTSAVPTTASGDSGTGDGTRSRLDGRLAGLLDASDRAAYAADHGLTYDEGSVLVVVELESGAEMPPSPPVAEATRHGSLVVGRVAVDDLSALATAEGVQYVRPPQAPVAADAVGRVGRTGRVGGR